MINVLFPGYGCSEWYTFVNFKENTPSLMFHSLWFITCITVHLLNFDAIKHMCMHVSLNSTGCEHYNYVLHNDALFVDYFCTILRPSLSSYVYFHYYAIAFPFLHVQLLIIATFFVFQNSNALNVKTL